MTINRNLKKGLLYIMSPMERLDMSINLSLGILHKSTAKLP